MAFLVSELDLTILLTQTVSFYFKIKIAEGSHEVKFVKNVVFINFQVLFLKMYIFVVTFFSRLMLIQSTQFLSGSTYLRL